MGDSLRTVRLCGAVAAGLGLLALLGWALGLPFLASLGSGRIPMAPSTALMFVLYGAAVILRTRLPLSRGPHRLGVVVASAGAGIASLLLVLSFSGIHPAAESLGFAASGSVGEAPVGHMSPVAAIGFLLASLSFLGSLPSSSSRPWRGASARWIAILLLAASAVLLLAYLFGRPLFYSGSFIPPAATTSIAFAALGTALLALAGRQSRTAGRAPAPLATVPRSLVLVFALLAAGIVTVGGLYFRSDARRYRAEVDHQLLAVAELKTSELAQWRAERAGDASVFLDNAAFVSLARRLFDDPQDAEARGQLRAWLAKVQASGSYDRLSLLDAGGVERLVVPEGQAAQSAVIERRVPEVLRSGVVTFEDFYRNEHDQRVYMTVLVPVLAGRGRALGVLSLRIDPETYLFPFIERWPTPARTAETLLVRREGNDVLFLNKPKLQQRAALTLRIPLASREVAGVQAVMGREGIVEAKDYRGVPVVAALRRVPGAPWFLVARMDSAEANAPLRERLGVMIFLLGAMLAAAAAGVGIVWREQRVRDLGERYATEQERAWLHDVVARSRNEIYMFDPETLRFRFANRGACRNIGYTQEELAELTPLELKPELTPETFRDLLAPLRTAERPVRAFETVHRRKDGSEYPVEVHLQLVDSGAGAVFLAVVNDITERRRAESRIRSLNRVYAVLSDVNQAIVRVRDPQALFAEACRIAVETGGFRMAWVGLLDAPTNSVRPVAHAGVTDGYLEKLQIALGEGDGPHGLGLIASALRQGVHLVSNDIEHDPRAAPWRDDALALGYRASAAFPLTVNGKTLGTLNLYASEPGFFDDEELGLLDEMAMDLAFAMETTRLEGVGRRLATAIEQSPVSVVITDANGRIEYVNPAFTWITGYTPEEALGGTPRMLKSGKQGPELYQELWATIRAGRSWHGELVNRRQDGSLYTQEQTIAPVHDAAGNVTHFVAISQDVTERKRTEEALRGNARELLDSQRVARLGSYRTDLVTGTWTSSVVLDGIFGIVDPAFRRDLPGWLSIVHPDEREAMAAYFAEEVLGRRQTFDREYRIVRQDDGQELWVHGLGKLVADGAGRLVEMIGTIQDITDRKRAEAELRSAEARYRGLFEQSPDGVLMMDAETGETLEANEAAHRQLGYTREEFSGLRISDYEALETPSETARRMQKVLAKGSDDFETLQRTKNGEIRNVHVWAKRIQLGERLAFHCIFEDITDRKRTEASLHASEERYRALFDRNLAGVYRTTLDGRVLECNDAFARIFGYASREEALSGHANALYPTPASRKAFLALLEADGAVVNHEFEGRRKDGTAVWLLENSHLVEGGEGDAGGIIEGTLLDVTERRNMEAELRQSQKIEAIGRLAGGVAHDFNNILGVILGYGELAEAELPPGNPAREQVMEMVKAANRAATLTRQLQAFSRNQVLQPKLLDLNNLVANTHKMLDRLIGEDIALVVRPAPDLGTVRADPGQVDQILLNLAVNARDAMPRGGTLTIETANVVLEEETATDHLQAKPGRYVRLAVSDTGVGMDAETQRRAFEPFFTTKPAGQGTGLGLAMVYGIVKQSGGYIWVYSELGQGTTFKIYLPRVDEAAAALPLSAPLAEIPAGHETILLVEDNLALREAVRLRLEGSGYSVILASDGEEALALAAARSEPIDLLLTDVVMPKLGGGELAQRLGTLRPGLPVLYMSGYTDGAIQQHGVLEEGAMLLAKPFTGDQLTRAVRDALNRSRPD